MATAKPVRIPREWSDAWFRDFYVQVLARDVVGVSQADVSADIAAHNADPDAHGLSLVPAVRTDETHTFFMAG